MASTSTLFPSTAALAVPPPGKHPYGYAPEAVVEIYKNAMSETLPPEEQKLAAAVAKAVITIDYNSDSKLLSKLATTATRQLQNTAQNNAEEILKEYRTRVAAKKIAEHC